MGADSERLAAIESRLNEATTGPWESDGAEVYVSSWRTWVAESLDTDDIPKGEANAAFIAHARDDVPWLLSRLRIVESERDMLLALVDDACASDDLTVLRDSQTERLLKETSE